jgi:hypothetical protein
MHISYKSHITFKSQFIQIKFQSNKKNQILQKQKTYLIQMKKSSLIQIKISNLIQIKDYI